MAGVLVGAVLYQYMQTSTLTGELKRRGFRQGKFDFARKVNLFKELPAGLAEFYFEKVNVGDTALGYNAAMGTVQSRSVERLMHVYKFTPKEPLNLLLEVSTINLEPPPFDMSAAGDDAIPLLVRADLEGLLMKGLAGRSPCTLHLTDESLLVRLDEDHDYDQVDPKFEWMSEVYDFIREETKGVKSLNSHFAGR